MGTVYLAVDPMGRVCAVKLVRPEIADQDVFRQRFRREVVMLQRVGGACTVRVLGAERDGPRPWVATDYVAGPTLQRQVRDAGPLRGETLTMVALGLAEALVSIHAAGVVHRDLKPSNVILALDGPKVLDFGIAQGADDAGLTGTGEVVGTVGWMSPEQLAGQRPGPPADVFAWAGLVSFAATGRAPFGSGPPEALMSRISFGKPDCDGVPAALRPLLLAAWQKDPRARPEARQLLTMLVPIARPGQGFDPQRVDQTATAVLAETWSRAWGGHAATGAALARTQPTPGWAPAVGASSRGRRRLLPAAAAVVALVLLGGGLLAGRLTASSSPGTAPQPLPTTSGAGHRLVVTPSRSFLQEVQTPEAQTARTAAPAMLVGRPTPIVGFYGSSSDGPTSTYLAAAKRLTDQPDYAQWPLLLDTLRKAAAVTGGDLASAPSYDADQAGGVLRCGPLGSSTSAGSTGAFCVRSDADTVGAGLSRDDQPSSLATTTTNLREAVEVPAG